MSKVRNGRKFGSRVARCASSSTSKGRDDAQALDEEQESLRERLILYGLADFGPIQLLSHGAYGEQGLLEIAVVLAERSKFGDHDRSRRQHGYPDAQDLVFLGAVKQRLGDGYAAQPMQYIDQRRLSAGAVASSSAT